MTATPPPLLNPPPPSPPHSAHAHAAVVLVIARAAVAVLRTSARQLCLLAAPAFQIRALSTSPIALRRPCVQDPHGALHFRGEGGEQGLAQTASWPPCRSH